MHASSAILWLVMFSGAFALSGMWYSRRDRGSLEDYVIARNSQGATATMLTLLASSMGAWILFSPAQAATWGGLAAIIGYALGSMSPRLVMIPLGRRMRELIPQGHTLTEFVVLRFGKPMYALTLLIMMFYMFISLTAEITAISKLVAMLAPVPLWVTAAIVMGSTLLYTSYGGLRASIFTDKVQMAVIIPLLGVLIAIGWKATGGIAPVIQGLQEQAPALLNLGDPVGIKAGLTFFVAILLTGLFHQGNWQRVYSANNTRNMRRGFLTGGLLVAPVIFIMGLFGLAFVGLERGTDSSIALFSVLMPAVPTWFAVALIPLGLALVMSTADTAISAVSSIIAVDARRLAPGMQRSTLMALSRWLIFLLAIPVMIVSAQGYSVLYLFLLADLLCSAAAFPVFFGLFNRRHNGPVAVVATICGLIVGLWFFPAPGAKPEYLLESFLLAALVPAVVIALLLRIQRSQVQFDFGMLGRTVRSLDD
ncbi:sodium:solute symporter family protein [Allopusillimonas ginsengisoli]|uniref:sodium:solute symporter family protein n=1 Tax=Allopusillimonas ginsengisoli TaxID=453575 RepID=UPI00101FFD05|nr:sodium:solute symporter family protein [Allopusillimonas ginsengisoli]TEA74239.1 sodium:solute symporter [Allopusillimonas ginsengisoli]